MLPLLLAIAIAPASAPAPSTAPLRETIAIRYRAVPICPTCVSFDLTVAPDGRGTIAWWRGPGPRGRDRFRWPPATVRAFAQAAAPLRPARDLEMTTRGERCDAAATDQDVVAIDWTGGPGGPHRLRWYLGCDMARHRAMLAALGGVERFAPLARYLGAPP